MWVSACGWGQFDQINSAVMEVVETMEDNAVIMEVSGHVCSIITVWGQGDEGSQAYKEGDGSHRKHSEYFLCILFYDFLHASTI